MNATERLAAALNGLGVDAEELLLVDPSLEQDLELGAAYAEARDAAAKRGMRITLGHYRWQSTGRWIARARGDIGGAMVTSWSQVSQTAALHTLAATLRAAK